MLENHKQAEEKRGLLNAYGEALDELFFCSALSLSKEKVHELNAQGKLLSFKDELEGTVYPAWQEHNGKILEGLGEVLQTLSEQSALSQLIFFITPNDYLEGVLSVELEDDDITPVDALRKNHVTSVIDAALVYQR